ncbi:MAG TPA: oligopeptide transporter, OPT family, partial [Sunxiuqinia sp.]|nr:oligopeptide transporter, OPT family [Sunxiuqinia sp.]
MAKKNSPASDFKPYISAKDFIPEFTPKAIFLGAIFGIIFGASSVYLGLKVGMTVSASIPIAVLAISVFKKIGNATILENNIVQTIGSAGESVAAGVVFTIPALLFLPGGMAYFKYFQIFVLALAGGILGVLFMIPLRRALIVKEHGALPYPEGTACADVLVAGEKGGNLARKVYYGLGIAFLYKLLMSIFGLWKDVPTLVFGRKSALPNGTINGEITPELLGVGYIIGPKIAGIMVAGGVLSWIVLIPLITLLGDKLTTVFAPGTELISAMTPDEIWNNYIRYIGAGAVTFGGLVTLIKSIPTIVGAFRDSFHDIKLSRANRQANVVKEVERTSRDLPLSVVLGGSLLLVIFMVLIPTIPTNFLSAIMIVIFGFFFVTVSSRIVGLIGSSSNPVSGMTIATLMATSLIFVGIGWTGDVYEPLALVVGSIVCIAVANAGSTSQDLKTGFLVGATPVKQQIGLMIGV